MKAIALLFSILTGAAFAALEPNTDWKASKEQGGIAQVVELNLKKTSIGSSFDIVVDWQPGTTVEVAAKITRSTPDRIEFTFEDNFGNSGKGVITSKGKSAEIDFETTTIAEPRGARQLGAYTLKQSK